MNIEELFNKYTQVFYYIDDKKGRELMDKDRFVAALSEALCCGQVQPVISQLGEAGSKGGPQNVGVDYKNLASELLGAILMHGNLSKFGVQNCERWTKLLQDG